ncbi:uncharacterized protein LOC126811184 [Patella vulgata]|uniref:uncharacterized protein LOC126811184 n=1 Tax=Patella vulgata TaxID=6465 RepID=UPI0024A925BE|nr:uncharacterized protein LOC126811184 [Patella vulgata]
MQDSANDTLPVVELRPFCKHVWRRDRSFVDFYSRSSETNEVGEERYLSHECLPNILEVLTEITQSSNKCKDEGLKRMRTKLHPKICNILTAPIDPKSPGIVPGFITKDDRAKTTFFWSRQDENPKSYSCRKQALNSATVRRQQQLQLQGGHLTLPENPPNQFVYLNPLANYKQRASLKQSKYRESQQKHSSAPAHDRINHMTSLPGKELDIVRILQRRSPNPRLRPISTAGKSGEKRKGPVMPESVRVDFWRNVNKHSIIERNLGEERTFHIRRCRRTIDIGFTPLDILQHLQNQNALNTKLTQGEILLKKGKEANAIKLEAEPKKELPVSVVEPRKPSKLLSIHRHGPCPIFKRCQTNGKALFFLDETSNSDDSGGDYFQNCEKIADSQMSKGHISRKENHVCENNDNKSQNSSVGNVFFSYQNERVEDAKLCCQSDEKIVQEGHTDMDNSSSTSKCSNRCNDGIQSGNNDTPLIDFVAHINYDALLANSVGSPVPAKPKILPKDTKGPHESPLVLRNDEGTSNSHVLCDQYEKRSSRGISDWSDDSVVKTNLNQNGETSNFLNLDNGEAVESANGIPRRPKMFAYVDDDSVQHKRDNNASRIVKDQLTHVENNDVVGSLDDVGGSILPSTTFLTTNV